MLFKILFRVFVVFFAQNIFFEVTKNFFCSCFLQQKKFSVENLFQKIQQNFQNIFSFFGPWPLFFNQICDTNSAFIFDFVSKNSSNLRCHHPSSTRFCPLFCPVHSSQALRLDGLIPRILARSRVSTRAYQYIYAPISLQQKNSNRSWSFCCLSCD